MKYFHLLIVDGCASHMIVGVVAKARAIGLDLITLSSQTLHALQPLDVSCFKSFKAAYCACSYSWALTYQGVKAWEKNLVSWVARALKNTMTLENSRHAEFSHWTRMQWMKKWHYWKHFCHEEQEEVVSIEEVMDINDACEDNMPCRYFVVEEEMSIHDIVNLVFIEEKQRSAITPFLTLLRHTLPTKETTTNPIIDYSRPLVMMSDEYMDAMAENARKKAHAENVRA